MRLHVGCGEHRLGDDWVNVDYKPTKATDMVFDVQDPWPLKDDTVTAIYSCHMLEHLDRPLDFFKEAHRVMCQGATMDLHFPYGGHRSAWWDLTHLRPWYAENFCILQPGYAEATHNPQHLDWKAFYGIASTHQRVGGELARALAGSWWRRRFYLPWLPFMTDAVEELFVHLFALKTPEAIETFKATRNSNSVPSMYVVWRHEWERRERREKEPLDLVPMPLPGTAA